MKMFPTAWALALLVALPACNTPELSMSGAKVLITRAPPPADCAPLGEVVGRGGGLFGGDLLANESLIVYARNDMLNSAAARGATHVHVDPPTFGHGDGTTTTVTLTGGAFRCGPEAPAALTPVASDPSACGRMASADARAAKAEPSVREALLRVAAHERARCPVPSNGSHAADKPRVTDTVIAATRSTP